MSETRETNLSLTEWAVRIMNTADANKKLTHHFADIWQTGQISTVGTAFPPDRPVRSDSLEVIAPGKAVKVGKGGTLQSRVAILHALANVEQWAIDTALDNMARFRAYVPNRCVHEDDPEPGAAAVERNDPGVAGGRATHAEEIEMPKAFFDDFVRMAAEEAKHFKWLNRRLEDLGSYYGFLPIHSGIWDSASETSHSALCRMAIVHMVHEARGLDVNPSTIGKFSASGDAQSTSMLELIHADEVSHVATGRRWFAWLCDRQLGIADPAAQEERFHALVRRHFRGGLKPPFNEEARREAGMEKGWYEPLAEVYVPKKERGDGEAGGVGMEKRRVPGKRRDGRRKGKGNEGEVL
ncbi:hypothetical protein BC938DRAFT_478457 [Jimgerdemannia flammicorona]|uniref:Ferritin-like superfamily n=1 Tax=Jimgerdemannia flammicorona TaxID=994334 RepID=A0A433QMW7_9FUNG|nr:hypothetical protein BC938DRAFT_478457 [Jimgerdemannia flammicorona]